MKKYQVSEIIFFTFTNQNYCKDLVRKIFHETCTKQNNVTDRLERWRVFLTLKLKWSPNRRAEAVQAGFQKFYTFIEKHCGEEICSWLIANA